MKAHTDGSGRSLKSILTRVAILTLGGLVLVLAWSWALQQFYVSGPGFVPVLVIPTLATFVYLYQLVKLFQD